MEAAEAESETALPAEKTLLMLGVSAGEHPKLMAHSASREESS